VVIYFIDTYSHKPIVNINAKTKDRLGIQFGIQSTECSLDIITSIQTSQYPVMLFDITI